MKTNKKKLLMLSSGLAGGSFMAFKNIAEIPNSFFDFTILGLGNYKGKDRNYNVIAIPYVRYDGFWGHISSKYTILGFFLQLPLYIVGGLYIILKRPSVVVFNGLATLLPLLPLTKLLGLKVVLSFRSWWDHDRFKLIEPLVQFCCQFVDFCIVNSAGTKENLSQILDKNKIKVVSHHAHNIYFKTRDRELLRQRYKIDDKFVMLYVGRIDEEKHCDFMIEVAKKLEHNKKFQFIFVGEGTLKQQIIDLTKKQSNVSYLGFITDKAKLAEVYTIADILWSNADETYFARPAIESLAAGTPIMVFRVPAIGEKILKKVEIPDSMVPPDIGWIIDHRDMTNVINLLTSLSTKKSLLEKREKAHKYAQKNFYTNPNETLIKEFAKLL